MRHAVTMLPVPLTRLAGGHVAARLSGSYPDGTFIIFEDQDYSARYQVRGIDGTEYVLKYAPRTMAEVSRSEPLARAAR